MTLTHNLSHFVETITWPLTHKSITHFFFCSRSHLLYQLVIKARLQRKCLRKFISRKIFKLHLSLYIINLRNNNTFRYDRWWTADERQWKWRNIPIDYSGDMFMRFFFCVSRTFWLWTFDAVEYRVWSHVELCGSRLIRFKVNGIIWLTMFHFIIFRWNLCGFGCRIGFWYFLSQYLLKHSIHAQKSFFYWRFFVLLNTWSSQIELNWVRQS